MSKNDSENSIGCRMVSYVQGSKPKWKMDKSWKKYESNLGQRMLANGQQMLTKGQHYAT